MSVISICAAKTDQLAPVTRLFHLMHSSHVANEPGIFAQFDSSNAAVHAFFAEILRRDDAQLAVATLNAETIGYVLVKRERQNKMFLRPVIIGHIRQICVDPSYRRRGIGTQLLSYGISLLHAMKAEEVHATYWSHNPAAHALFQAHGFNTMRTVVRKTAHPRHREER